MTHLERDPSETGALVGSQALLAHGTVVVSRMVVKRAREEISGIMTATNQCQLYVMCGLPFSGKSTLARALAAFRGYGLVVYDTINSERGIGVDGAPIPPHEWERTEAEVHRRVMELTRRWRNVCGACLTTWTETWVAPGVSAVRPLLPKDHR